MLLNVFANRVKDAALQYLAKWFANHYHLKHLGRITELKLNSPEQEIHMTLELHGEPLPMELTVHYHVLSPTLLEIAKVEASRQWIEALINEVIPMEQKRLEVPTAVTRALSKMEK